MRLIAPALSLLLFALSACGALAATPDQYLLLLNNSKASAGPPPYVPPVITGGLAVAYGDSRVSNAGAVSYSGTAFTVPISYSNAWSPEIPWQSNNTIQYSYTWDYGVGASSSAGIYAREQLTGYYCNNGTTSSANGPCFTGVKTTTSGTNSSGSGTINITSATGLVAGTYYIFLVNPSNLDLNPETTTTCPGGGCTTAISISPNIVTTISAGTTIVFSPAAQTNPFWNGLDATLTGWTVTDPSENANNVNLYSVCNDPAKLVFFMTGTNDGSLVFTAGTPQPLINIGKIFDALGPSGCNKLVIAGNEIPKGLATATEEVQSVPASPTYTISPTNVGTYYDDQGVYYAPSAVSNAMGANDGVAFTKIANVAGVCTVTVTGDYCITSGNVYTFASGDASAQVLVRYRYAASGATSSLTTIHNWLNSTTCGNFTDPVTSTTYAIKGAQCKRPWVKMADTWDQVLDAAISTPSTPLPQAYFSVDGLHPISAYGTKISKVMDALAAPYVGSTPIIALPTINNPVTTSNNSSSLTSAQTTTCTGITGTTKNYFINTLSPAVSTGIYGAAGSGLNIKIYPLATSGAPIPSTVDCLDSTNNLMHMTAPATATISLGAMYVQTDFNSIAFGGVFDHRSVTNTAVTNCNSKCGTVAGATAGYPTNWPLTLSASNNTDLTAGTLGINYGVETNGMSPADGNDDFVLQIFGKTTTAALAASIGTGGNATADAALITAGDLHRVSCKVQISAGPNGHLWGVYMPQLVLVDAPGSGTYTPPGAANGNYTNWTSETGGAAPGLAMTDADLLNGSGGVLTIQLTTPPTLTTGFGGTITSLPKVLFGSDNGVPVSATIRVSRCIIEKVSN